MLTRLAKAIAVFLFLVLPAAMVTHTFLAGLQNPANAIGGPSKHATLIGMLIAFLAAIATWRQSAPAAAGGLSARPAAGPAPSQQDGPPAGWPVIAAAVTAFVAALFATMALASAWIMPGRGGLDYAPEAATLLPGLTIGLFAAQFTYRAAKRMSRSRGASGDAWSAEASHGDGALDWGVLALTFVAGCFFLTLAVTRDAGAAALVAGVLFGTAAAACYDSRVGQVLRLAAVPRLQQILLVGLCSLTMLVVVTTICVIAPPFREYHPLPGALALNVAGRTLSAVAALLLAVPLLAGIVRDAPADGEAKPLWPLLAALAGGGFCWFLLAGQWTVFTAPLRYGAIDWVRPAMQAGAMPIASLFLGASVSVWFQALVRTDQTGLDWDRLFPAAIRSGLLLTGLALLLFLMVSFGLSGPAGSTVKGNATLSIITCLVWLSALARILPLQPRSALRGIGVVFALTMLMSLMFGFASFGWDPYLGDVLLLVISLPVLLAGWFVVGVMVPRWVRGWL